MKTQPKHARLVSLATLLLLTAGAANAQNIYKCSNAGKVEYTDRACTGGNGQLIHQADDTEVIDQFLDLGQDAAAKAYADSHHLEALYKQRLEVRKQNLQARAQQQADATAEQKKSDTAARQQALVDAEANRGRLQGENNALRLQNAAYLNQLSQPVNNNSGAYYNAGPGYWNGGLPYGGGYGYGSGHDHDHDHDPGHGHGPTPATPFQPVEHPCTQLAGGRVTC